MNTNIAKDIANTFTNTRHPKYLGSSFEAIADLPSKTKGKAFETMVSAVLEAEGHEVFEASNGEHDFRVRFKGEHHRTKIEVKGAMLQRDKDILSTGCFVMDDDFDEVFVFFVFPEEVQGWRINRSTLRGLDNDGVMGTSKGSRMFGSISPEMLALYDCPRVF